MCKKINRLIDSPSEDIPANVNNKYAYILGRIGSCLELAGRRKGSGSAEAGNG
jgi:hypothetical protein